MSNLSLGDIVTLANAIYQVYSKFSNAPKEMQALAEKVKLVKVLLNPGAKSQGQLDFLQSPEGRPLFEQLQLHLRSLQRTLCQIDDVGKQWKKAQQSWWRRAPFVLYTMRVVPDLQADLVAGLDDIKTIREWANQAGVALGPTALKQIERLIAESALKRRSVAGSVRSVAGSRMGVDDFDEVERKRRTACSALKRSATSASTSRKQPSIAEQKSDACKELTESGLPLREAQILSELYEMELENAALEATLKATAKAAETKHSAKSAKSVKNAKSVEMSLAGKLKAKSNVIMVQVKPAKPGSRLQRVTSNKSEQKDQPGGTILTHATKKKVNQAVKATPKDKPTSSKTPTPEVRELESQQFQGGTSEVAIAVKGTDQKKKSPTKAQTKVVDVKKATCEMGKTKKEPNEENKSTNEPKAKQADKPKTEQTGKKQSDAKKAKDKSSKPGDAKQSGKPLEGSALERKPNNKDDDRSAVANGEVDAGGEQQDKKKRGRKKSSSKDAGDGKGKEQKQIEAAPLVGGSELGIGALVGWDRWIEQKKQKTRGEVSLVAA